MTTLMLLSFIPAQVKAANEKAAVSAAAAKPAESAEATAQLARLEEIKAMDFSTMSRSEKKELREEVRAIKTAQDERGRRNYDRRGGQYGHRHGGTVFVLGGGGVLIVLLIILLLYVIGNYNCSLFRKLSAQKMATKMLSHQI